MRGTDRLLELQELDSAIDRLEQRRQQLEAGTELAEARVAMEEAESRLGELRLALDAVAVEQRRLENEIDSMDQKAAADEKRLYDGSIANTKELEALQHEIASIKERKSRTEDELLERMERREDLERRAAVEQEAVTAARSRVEAVGGDAVRELELVTAQLTERRAARDVLVPEFDEELLELYDDLRRQKRGVGAAALVDGVCQACHEKLSALELDRLKHTDGIKRCEYCRRIVVFA
ncbi:MAG TPA: C4-type zinc ribbon domain-containing protein [Actinomycetota bacterium]|nr:C4-type zinc ribbon domain-containing protein [Actinomycetota bacterium]